ncbi:MAG: AmmeMemoRadiSam system radical SAM enzyme [Syntrophales bacterium]|nr:AmmeMemoRadiSam system radical SAM enzyme [Syntrophales bacterium]
MHEAMLYERGENKEIRCNLCAHRCRISLGRRGVCGVRENVDGTLYSLVYGKLIAENVDPIEKKPLFHIYPGSRSYSIATVGCNFRCLFCQNADISQMPRETGEIMGRKATPEEVVERAIRSGSRTVAYTYTEPTVFFEFAFDVATYAAKRGLKNVFVTNGYMTHEALETIAPVLHGANVDLKSFQEEFYIKQCGAKLSPVLDSLKKMKELGIWVEVTTLIIPGLNDSKEELRKIAEFVLSLGRETPWHVSRFYPRYKVLDKHPTPIETVYKALKIGRDVGLKYVYSGNIPGGEGEDTFCANCGKTLVSRYGYLIKGYYVKDGRCSYCGETLDGIF